MREIRYRAWDKISETMGVWDDESKMVLFTQELDNGEYIIHKVSLDILIGNPNYELMQYTGLKDKNGKEIWEGDIVDVWYPDVKSPHHTSSVIYRRNAMCFDTEWVDDFIRAECTVIGNIYENPYLLNQSK